MNSVLSVQLQSYKCFAETTIDFGQLTVLTGTNSGGKTTVLTALLLLKWGSYYEPESRRHHWPNHLGGVPIGDADTHLSFGSSNTCVLSVVGAKSPRFYIAKDVLGWDGSHVVAPFDAVWRVCSTRHLPLTEEQEVIACSLAEDKLYDLRHALLELNEYDVRRKPMSGSSQGHLRTVVEHALAAIVGPVRVQLKASGLEQKLILRYLANDIAGDEMVPEQVGAGVTAALPIVIHLIAAVPGEVVILQDPESHLHPRGQAQMGREIAKCAARGVMVVVETHSEHILNGIKLGLLELNRNPAEDLACYYVNCLDKENQIRKIEIDSRGLTRSWPRGFFDQAAQDLAELARGIQRGG